MKNKASANDAMFAGELSEGIAKAELGLPSGQDNVAKVSMMTFNISGCAMILTSGVIVAACRHTVVFSDAKFVNVEAIWLIGVQHSAIDVEVELAVLPGLLLQIDSSDGHARILSI